MNIRWENAIYRFMDLMLSLLAWYLFINYLHSHQYFLGDADQVCKNLFVQGALFLPIAWFLFYLLSEQYKDVYRLSRWSVFSRTFLLSAFGCLVVFFVLID